MNLTESALNWVATHWIQSALWVIVTALLVWFFVKNGSKIRTFLIETKVELSKCIWPIDPQEKGYARYQGLVQSTVVVVVASVLISLYIMFSDVVLTSLIRTFILKIGE